MDESRSSPWVDAMFTAMLGGFVGIGVTLPAVLLAVASAGAGHGDYGVARLLFPYSMVLWRGHGATFDSGLILLALVQFPILGAILSASWPMRTTVRQAVWAVVGIVHIGACCFGVAFGVR